MQTPAQLRNFPGGEAEVLAFDPVGAQVAHMSGSTWDKRGPLRCRHRPRGMAPILEDLT